MLLSAAIAERKASELREIDSADTLRHREEMLRLAQRAGGVATFEWDFQNQLANCSAEFFEMFGLPPRDGEMQGAEWAKFVHPDDRERMGAHLARALARTEPAATDYRIIRADGVERWLTYAAQIRDTPAGARMLGTVADITDRKRMESALREAKEAAESANQLKDQFLATLSHELRTPLNAILGYARMLKTDSIAPEKRPRAIDIIERNATAQNQLIEDLLDISRITRGQVRLEPMPTSIDAVLREAVEGVRPAADAKRVALEVNIDPVAGMVTADATRLQQVFWNLLTNAVKFTSQRGRVTASVRRFGKDEVEVAVTDTGEDPGRLPAFCLRAVAPGRCEACAQPWRVGTRPGHFQAARRTARRDDSREQRRRGPRRDVRGPFAASRRLGRERVDTDLYRRQRTDVAERQKRHPPRWRRRSARRRR